MVMMWTPRSRLITSSIEASVVDLPEPVGPVTSMRPRGLKRSSFTVSGRPICSRERSVDGIMRSTQPQRLRSLKTDTRKRVPSSCDRAKSAPPFFSTSADCSAVIISWQSLKVSSSLKASSAISTSSPCMRSFGGMNARTCRSDAPSSIVACSRSFIVISVAIASPVLADGIIAQLCPAPQGGKSVSSLPVRGWCGILAA